MDAAIPLVVCALGSTLAWALLPPTTKMRGLVALVTGPSLGFGILSIGIIASFGLGLGFPSRWALWILIVAPAAGALAWRLHRNPPQPREFRPLARVDYGEIALSVLLLLGILLSGHRAWVSVREQPYGTPDAISIWNGRANYLYRAGDDAQEVFRKLKHGHPDYPLFLSGAIAGQFQLAGRDSIRIPLSTSIVLAAACVGALGLTLLSWAGRKAALIGCSILLVMPAFNKWAASQNSDIALGYVGVLALWALSSLVDHTADDSARLPPLLIGFLVGLPVWIKDEGIILMCALLGGAVIALIFERGKGRPWNRLGWMGLGMAVPLLATAVFKVSWVTTSQIARVAEDNLIAKLVMWERWPIVVDAFLIEFSPVHEARAWGFAWAAMGFLAVWRWRTLWSGSVQRLATATVTLAFLGYFTIYILTPQPLEWHLKTSLQRLFLQLLPLAIAWVGALSTMANEHQYEEPEAAHSGERESG